MRSITLVKKILTTGETCAKCIDVEQQLKKNDQLKFIDKTIIADERDPESEGIRLANKLNVNRAPFFVVEEGGNTNVYVSYLKFAKEVLSAQSSKKQQLEELSQMSSDIDFI